MGPLRRRHDPGIEDGHRFAMRSAGVAAGRSSFSSGGKSGLLRAYFASGWAFFLPYLASYLIYCALDWNVHASTHLIGRWQAPSLVAIFDFWHVLHIGLGIAAFWPAGKAKPGHCLASWASLTPWLPLLLFFLLPGAYLEFPSDPWEHLKRIDDWAGIDQISHDGNWLKFSYFLEYSVLRFAGPGRQLPWLGIYCAAVGLLLCVQYGRLARAAGVSPSGAMIFAILQAVLFGNNTFSFFRYYALSSTLVSQIGLIAFLTLMIHAFTTLRTEWWGWPEACRLIVGGLCLSVLMAFNHPQELGMAVIGTGAVIGWVCTERCRRNFIYVVLFCAVASVGAICWLPRNPAIDAIYIPSEIITRLYGFNLFNPASIAFDRAVDIIGGLGMAGLAAALLLAARNDVTAWLTLGPVFALCLPCVAIPFANVVTTHGGVGDIKTFQRLLLGIPAGLAIVKLIEVLPRWTAGIRLAANRKAEKAAASAGIGPGLVSLGWIIGLGALTVLPASTPYYNRFWSATVCVPADLAMHSAWTDEARFLQEDQERSNGLFASTPAIEFVTIAERPVRVVAAARTYFNDHTVLADRIGLVKYTLYNEPNKSLITEMIPKYAAMYTPYSFAALASKHWLPQEVAIGFCGGPEYRSIARHLGLTAASGTADSLVFYTHPNDK